MEADVRRGTRSFVSPSSVAIVLVGWLGLATPLAAQQIDPHVTGPYAGKQVVDVLAQLQLAGARIIFSGALVSEMLVVETEPKRRVTARPSCCTARSTI